LQLADYFVPDITIEDITERKTRLVAPRNKLQHAPCPSELNTLRSLKGNVVCFNARFQTHIEDQLKQRSTSHQHIPGVILSHILDALYLEWVNTMRRLELEIKETGSYKNIRDDKGDNFEVEKLKNLVAWSQDQVSESFAALRESGFKPALRSDQSIHKGEMSRRCENQVTDFSRRNWHQLERLYGKLQSQLHRFHGELDDMSKMRLMLVQLAESRKAITQAESVRRLTNLAFVFIPATYMASVFSADIRGLDHQRTVGVFAAWTVGITALAILLALTLEQVIWPTVLWPFRKWRDAIWGFLNKVGVADAEYHRQRRSGWYLLPKKTIQFGWLGVIWCLGFVRWKLKRIFISSVSSTSENV
jgi:hypothetical protein